MMLSDDKWYIVGSFDRECCLVHFKKNVFYSNVGKVKLISNNCLDKQFYIDVGAQEASEEQVMLHFLANGVCIDGNKTGS